MDLLKRSELPAWLLQRFGSTGNLAAKLGVTRQTAHNLLTGKTAPNDETCAKLGLDPVFLLEEKRRQMSTLDAFLQRRERDRQSQNALDATTRLVAQRGPEMWLELQQATESTAVRVGSIDGNQLEWHSFPFLNLQYVAATFTPGIFGGIALRGCRVVFGRIPTAMYVDDNPLSPEVWDLTLSAHGDRLLWNVNNDEIVGFTTAELAEQIVMRLIQYRDDYQAACANALIGRA